MNKKESNVGDIDERPAKRLKLVKFINALQFSTKTSRISVFFCRMSALMMFRQISNHRTSFTLAVLIRQRVKPICWIFYRISARFLTQQLNRTNERLWSNLKSTRKGFLHCLLKHLVNLFRKFIQLFGALLMHKRITFSSLDSKRRLNIQRPK